MISLRFFSAGDSVVLNYELDEDQAKYTATVEQSLQWMKEGGSEGQAFSVTIFKDDMPAGYFVLDFGEDKLDLTDNPHSVLLRSLSVNPKFQGKGIGKEAMLQVDDFIRRYFKDCDEIVLAVNQNNRIAYHLYLKSGYFFDGKTRMGRSGLQYLMSKKL